MKVIIVYGTNSSGTETVSGNIAAQLSAAGHTVTVKRATEALPTDLAGHDLILLGSCSWEKFVDGKKHEGQLQEHMESFLEHLEGQRFDNQNFAIFGLGDSSYQFFCGAVDLLEKFVQDAGGKLIVPSLRIDGYYFDRDTNDQKVRDWVKQL